MDEGSEELRKLGELLRIGARTARLISSTRPLDQAAIDGLADRAEQIADELDAIIAKSSARREAAAPEKKGLN